MKKRPHRDKRRFTLLVNPKIREEQERQTAMQRFVKECERLYERNRARRD